MEKQKILIVGSGVVGIYAATKLIDGGYPGELITIIDAGKDPYLREEDELMKGFAGGGLKSDGKLTRSIHVGGQLAKYCGEEKAYGLMDETIEMLKRFHPDSSKMVKSEPLEEPEFIKPYFNLRLFPVWHIGTDYLDIIGKTWYNWLVDKKINFCFESTVKDIDFNKQIVYYNNSEIYYDKLIYSTGKSGIDLTQKLITKHQLETNSKANQLGVRMELPQKYVQRLVDISYDFKLYQKYNDKVSVRTFCTNSGAAYVAIEETYGDITFNGHSRKDPKYFNNMTNFGVLMEIKDDTIKDPFVWSRNIISKCQRKIGDKKVGIYYSPNKLRRPSLTAEGEQIECFELDSLDEFKKIYGEYSLPIIKFIDDFNKVFKMGDDYGIYIGEVKYLSGEVKVNHNNLSLITYPNVYFAGDALSARGIVVSASHGIYIAESLLK